MTGNGTYARTTHDSVSGGEAADRLALRELVDAYAHCADRRDANGQMALFTPDTHFVVFMEAKSTTPSMELHKRTDLAPVFDELNKYEATTHFMGQSTVSVEGDRATGETYCLAHHVSASEGKRTLFVASLRYYDAFVKVDGTWFFAERKLMVDWTDTRPLS
jgi:hypothetical protein